MDGECEPPWKGSRRVSRSRPGRIATLDAPARGARGVVSPIAWLVVASFAVLLAGCGFHLQGSGSSLPEGTRKVFISTSDELTPFAIELRRAIERSGGEIVTSSAAAETVLRIQRDRSGRRVLSVSASNTPQEFEIFYNVEYSVDRAGKEVIELQLLELVRNLSFDESQLLAKDQEEAILHDALARDLALLVVRRLESL